MITTLFAKFENGDIARVSLLLNKEIVAKNLTACFTDYGHAAGKYANKFDAIHWDIFTSAFESINRDEGVVGYNYDKSMTKGIVAIATTRDNLAEMDNA